MPSLNSSELRLKLMDSLSDTLVQFIDHDDADEDTKEAIRIAQDISEYIVDFLGIQFKPDQKSDFPVIATMRRSAPAQQQAE